MPRPLESTNPSILRVVSATRRCNCKLCGVEIPIGTKKFALDHNGARLSFCISCVSDAFSKLRKEY